MKLYGFVDLYCAFPSFPYPLFTDGKEYFFEDGREKYIRDFIPIAQNDFHSFHINRINSTEEQFGIGSPTIYAFQKLPNSKIVWGDSDTFLPFLSRYYDNLKKSDSNNLLLLTEVKQIIWDILLQNGVLQNEVLHKKRQFGYLTLPHLYERPTEEKPERLFLEYCYPIIERSQRRHGRVFFRHEISPAQAQCIAWRTMSASMKTIFELFADITEISQPFCTDNFINSINQIVRAETVNQIHIHAEKKRLALPVSVGVDGMIDSGISQQTDECGTTDFIIKK